MPCMSLTAGSTGAVSCYLAEGLHHVVHVHVAQDDAQAVAALQLLYAVVHVLRLQQVEPAAGDALSCF